MKHVVMFSGGVGSWAAAWRVASEHGLDQLTLLFTDTRIEDEDLYRFLLEGAAKLCDVDVSDLVPEALALPPVEADRMPERIAALERLSARAMARIPILTWIAAGPDVWTLFEAEGMMGNSRADMCSRILKRELADAWIEEHYDQADTTVYVGIDWTEEHRIVGLRALKAPWRYEAPLCRKPYLTKRDMQRTLRALGVRPPRLYDLGFAHNNCGGFCIKAGFGHFANLLRVMPERYAYHERKEEEFRQRLGRTDITILKRQPYRDKDGKRVGYEPVSLRQFREEVQANGQVDMFDIGGCGCFVTQESES